MAKAAAAAVAEAAAAAVAGKEEATPEHDALVGVALQIFCSAARSSSVEKDVRSSFAAAHVFLAVADEHP